MKLHEVLDQPQHALDEGVLQNIIAAAGIVLAALPQVGQTPHLDAQRALALVSHQHGSEHQFGQLVTAVASKYKVDPKIVHATVKSAIKYQREDFPTAKDILAVVGTESSFKPSAKSALKTDPAIGLMQVRPGSWKMSPKSLQTIDSQIKTGAEILHKYYVILGSRDAALHAYNVGLTNHHTKKVTNPRYVPKVEKELDLYKDI